MRTLALDDALEIYDLGYPVIPFNGKIPTLEWKQYQNSRPDRKQTIEMFRGHRGNVGIITGESLILDVDNFTEATPELDRYEFSGNIPQASTPRGGQHWYFENPGRVIGSGTKVLPGVDIRANGGVIVCPPSEGYAWIKPLCPVGELSEPPAPFLHALKEKQLYKESFSSSYKNVKGIVKNAFTEGRRDDDIFHAANCLIKGGMHEDTVRDILYKLALTCDPPFPEREIEAKIQSALNRDEARNQNISGDLRKWILLNDCYFSVKDCYNELNLLNPNQKATARVVLHSMCKDGILERHPSRAGMYRRVESEIEETNWQSMDADPFDLSWPFDLQDLVDTYSKNIIVVAGSPDAGKTAFLLETTRLNMNKYPIHYFSSEMGGVELRKRLNKFNIPMNEWKFKFYERASNFADVIKPDNVNIIDYLEIHQEHYLIGAWIKQIFDRLRNGIAIIAIQKKPKADTGVGGMTTKEKPRLYLTMEHGVIRIEKAKNWVNGEVNPNGMQCKFKLVQGCKFNMIENWRK